MNKENYLPWVFHTVGIPFWEVYLENMHMKGKIPKSKIKNETSQITGGSQKATAGNQKAIHTFIQKSKFRRNSVLECNSKNCLPVARRSRSSNSSSSSFSMCNVCI